MTRTPLLLACAILLGAAAPQADPIAVPVAVAAKLGEHQSGRLIVFVEKATPDARPDTPVDFDSFEDFAPTGTTIAAREALDLSPGRVALIDGDSDTYPAPLSTLPPGSYRIQAVLDRNHDYSYSGRGEGDLVSGVATVTLPGPVPTLTLDRRVPAVDEDTYWQMAPAANRPILRTWLPRVKPLDFVSPAVSAFRGAPAHLRGWVALPPGYDGKKRFPTVYVDSGFGGTLASIKGDAAMRMARMAEGSLPPMIWVFLDHSGPTGTHEFADSVNNGPWGRALTDELIPALERQFAMDARPNGRFLTGHSSGGWSVLWLQVRYPTLFGGSWPTSPDPSDFHDFTNVDLYAPNANFYRDADGRTMPLMRMNGKAVATTEQFARSEAVLGAYGGQIASFDWVFSPRGADGQPLPMFDRATGRIDPAVVAYWRDHFDVAHIVVRDAARLRPDLDGKIHLTVGDADTFYLDGPAHRLEKAMAKARIRASFTYLPGKTHFDLYARGNDPIALTRDFVWAMYAIARPGSHRPGS